MKKFNFEEFLWFITLILLDLSVIYLVYTGKISSYIGNSLIKYMYITIIMISIITVAQIKNIFTSKGNGNIKMKLIPIILTIILGIISVNNLQTFRHSELDEDIRENRTSKIDRRSLYEHEFNYTFNKNKGNVNKDYKRNQESDINGNKQETIIIDDNNPMTIEDIRIKPEKYIGRKLEIHGFICKETYLNKNQFIIGKIIMNCCAADSKAVGLVGEYDQIENLSESENVKILGTLSTSTIKDENNVIHRIPVVKVEKIEIEK
ncbi:DUF1980 domain-containing protein [Clostridium chromiireducens]|uniref:DUF1980 domain-containing protein n=1 Tax=Clostridium chromiireducens TaxID=225345 RepID=A0A399INK9_9CLOT|nr:DUF1980 domain-containing protein [Clostridium chromiireducens]RII34531.1 DUF1980 domain-containing protein [Clostridium chromiireducens]